MKVFCRLILTSVFVAMFMLALLMGTPPAFADWQLQSSGTTSDLRAVDFVSRSVGFAVGNLEGQTSGAVILKTKDGGQTWAPLPVPASFIAEHVDFIDTKHGWVSGGGTLLRTRDGGASWEQQDPGNTAEAICFINAHIGWAAGGQEVSRTTDGGGQWTHVSVLPATAHVNDVSFFDAMRGYFLDTSGDVYASDPTLVDEVHGTLVDDAGDIYWSSDGGLSWTLQKQTSQSLNAVSMLNRWVAWAVGDAGRIWQGVVDSWDPKVSGVEASLTDVFIPESRNGLGEDGWAVGGGTVVSTTDGGFTWLPVSLPTTATLDAVSGITAKCVWLAGSGGTILHYSVPDTTQPYVHAPESSRVRRYHLTRLWYTTVDPDDATLAVSIRIRTLSGRLVKTLWLGQVHTGGSFIWLRCGLPKGTYHFFVRATDVAGNHETKVRHNTLIVY